MAKYTSQERERILDSRLPGETYTCMSERTGVSAVTLSKWIRGKKVTTKSNFTRLHIGTVSDPTQVIRVHKSGVVIELPVDVDHNIIKVLLGW